MQKPEAGGTFTMINDDSMINVCINVSGQDKDVRTNVSGHSQARNIAVFVVHVFVEAASLGNYFTIHVCSLLQIILN